MIRYCSQSASTASIVGTQIFIGEGGGMPNVPAQLGVKDSALSNQNVGVARAIYLTSMKIGGAVGSAILVRFGGRIFQGY